MKWIKSLWYWIVLELSTAKKRYARNVACKLIEEKKLTEAIMIAVKNTKAIRGPFVMYNCNNKIPRFLLLAHLDNALMTRSIFNVLGALVESGAIDRTYGIGFLINDLVTDSNKLTEARMVMTAMKSNGILEDNVVSKALAKVW